MFQIFAGIFIAFKAKIDFIFFKQIASFSQKGTLLMPGPATSAMADFPSGFG
jgi:hypothetical protein